MTSKNELGIFVAFALIHTLAYGDRKGRAWLIGVYLGLLALSNSQGALVALGAGVSAQFIFAKVYLPRVAMAPRTKRSRRRVLAAVSAICALLGLLWYKFDDLLVVMGKDPTLSRRTEIWRVLMNSLQEQPVFGGGLGAQIYPGSIFERLIQSVAGPTVHTAHNGYIPIYMGLGLVGIAVLVGAIVQVIHRVHYVSRSPGNGARSDLLLAIGMLAGYLCVGVVEDTLVKRGALLCLMIGIGRLARHTLPREPESVASTTENS